MMFSHTPIYTDTPLYTGAIKWLLGGITAVTLVIGIILIPFDIVGTYIMLGITVFDAALFWCILPKRFEVYEDRLTIKLGGPFAIHIFFPDLESVRVSNYKEDAYAYLGMKLATSSEYVVEIKRKKGFDIVISPSGKEEFIEQVNRAKANFREPDFDKLFEEKMNQLR